MGVGIGNGRGGKRAGAGRPKGRLNQETADIKAMVVGALQAVGGVDYLATCAIEQPSAFLALVGRVLPLQMTGADGGALLIDFRWQDSPSQPPVIEADPVADETITVTFDVGEC